MQIPTECHAKTDQFVRMQPGKKCCTPVHIREMLFFFFFLGGFLSLKMHTHISVSSHISLHSNLILFSLCYVFIYLFLSLRGGGGG